MKTTLLCTLFLAGFFAQTLKAQTTPDANNILYVNKSVSGGTGHGDSWTNAMPELRDALSWAATQTFTSVNPLHIWVAEGLYLPTANTIDRDASFQLLNNVQVYGGFNGDETALSQRDPNVNVVILSGDIANDDLQDIISDPTTEIIGDNSYNVVKGSNINATAVLDGFTITAGNANGSGEFTSPSISGAGIYINDGSPTFARLKVVGNKVIDRGGGMFINGAESSPVFTDGSFANNYSSMNDAGFYNIGNFTIVNSTISGNTSADLTAGFYNSGTITINNCTVSENMSNAEAGGFYNGGTATINNSSFIGNTANKGGAIYNIGNLTITNSNISENTATNQGGGLFNSGTVMGINSAVTGNTAISGGGIYSESMGLTLTNSIISGNTATIRGGGIAIFVFTMTPSSISTNMNNTIVWGNASSLSMGNEIYIYAYNQEINMNHCLTGNGANDVSNDFGITYNDNNGIHEDPLFTDPVNGDFTLQMNSPAINAGDNALYEAADGNTANNSLQNDTDLGGNQRLYDGTPTNDIIDMGTYELQQDVVVPITPDANNILYINDDATGTGSGSSWTDAVPQLADALVYAKQNETSWTTASPLQIWVAGGTYKPLYSPRDGANFADENRDNAFLMVNNVQLYGGFAGTEITLAQRDQSFNANPTILSGDIGVENSKNDNAHHVVVASGPTGSAKLDGFDITKAFTDIIGTSSITIDGNNFLRSSGGGLYANGAQLDLVNLKITGNEINYRGGGIYSDNSQLDLLNVLIADNIAGNNGKGILATGAGTIDFVNSTLANNVNLAGNSDYSITLYPGSAFNGDNAVVFGARVAFGGTFDFEHSFLEGNTSTANNNINTTGFSQTDLFNDPVNGDFTLQLNSPAINAGSNDLYVGAGGNLTEGLDLAGNPRIYNYTTELPNYGFIDMGAYEYEGSETTFIYQNDTAGWLLPMGNPNGVSTFHEDILVQNGTAFFTDDIEVNNLTVDSGAILNIEQALKMHKDIVNNGTIIFKSNATMLGQMGPMENSTVTGIGEMTVERFIPARNDGKGAYRYLTSSLNSSGSIHSNWQEGATGINDNPNPGFGMFINGSVENSGFDVTVAPSMFSYANFNNPTEEYTAITNTNVDHLIAGLPYCVYVWGDRSVDISTTNDPPATSTTLRITGNPYIGTKTISDLNNTVGGFSLIGNPYQAIVDMNNLMDTSTDINKLIYYVWDPNLGTRGAYATITLGTIGSTTPSTSEANQYLMPGQAVWVVSTGISPSLTFQESNKSLVADQTGVFRPENVNTFIELQLFQANRYANNETLSDAVTINFSETENNAVLQNDAPKLINWDENLSRTNGDKLLSVENRSMPIDGEVLPLFNNQYRTSNYVFNAVVENFPAGTTVYLRDSYIDTQIELMNNMATPIEFTVDQNIAASIAPDRFSLVFSKNTMDTNDGFLATGISIYPNPIQNSELVIAAPGLSHEKVGISLFNVLGKKVYASQAIVPHNEHLNIPVYFLQTGVYLVKVGHKGKIFASKIIVE